MSYQTILVRPDGAVTVVTLNRPGRLNALNRTMIAELHDALDAAARDGRTRALVLTGAGRAFCAGADLSDPGGPGGLLPDPSPESKRQGLRHGIHPLILAIHRADLPVIAMVNGDAAAGGCDLALACDLRVAAEPARFMESFARIGLFPGTGGCWFLPRQVGLAKASEMMFTGAPLGAADAYRLGLVNDVAPAAELEPRTMALARRVAAGPPIAVRLAKMVMYRSLTMDLATSLELAAACESITLTSRDHEAGLAAFRDRREPTFEGR